MAKKKAGAQGKKQSGFMVRLPDRVRGPLNELKEKYQRPTTSEVLIALAKHFRDENVGQDRKS